MLPVHTILFPTDFSEPSLAAFPLACSLARDLGARLVILYVTPPPLGHDELEARRDPDTYYQGLWKLLRGPQPPNEDIAVERARVVVDDIEQDGDAADVAQVHECLQLVNGVVEYVSEESRPLFSHRL
jgi:nucleotide-binding universal stress UspA family protein